MMRLILEYNDYLEQAALSIDINEGANLSAPVVGSDVEEDRPIVVFRLPQKKAKTAAKITPPKKITKKTTKQTDKTGETQSISAATNSCSTATTTETEEVLIASDEYFSLITLNRHIRNIQPERGIGKEH